MRWGWRARTANLDLGFDLARIAAKALFAHARANSKSPTAKEMHHSVGFCEPAGARSTIAPSRSHPYCGRARLEESIGLSSIKHDCRVFSTSILRGLLMSAQP